MIIYVRIDRKQYWTG